MGYAKTLKLCFLVGDLDPPETRKGYIGSRVEDEEGALVAPHTRV